MAFQLSPGVLVTETDLTNIVPTVGASVGAFAGTFAWGPVLDPTQITSENQLVTRFGKPNDENASSFFTVANFLSYTNNLQLVRVDTDGQCNAVAKVKEEFTVGASVALNALIKGNTYKITATGTGTNWLDIGAESTDVGTIFDYNGVTATGNGTCVAYLSEGIKYKIVTVGDTNWSAIGANSTVAGSSFTYNGVAITGSTGVVREVLVINNDSYYDEFYASGGANNGVWCARFPGDLGNSLRVEMVDSGARGWSKSLDNLAIKTDELVDYKNYTVTDIGTEFTLDGVEIDNTTGDFLCDTATLVVGQQVTISGTNTGDGLVTNGTYKISVTASATEFTLVNLDGTSIVTVGGTTTGLTFTVTTEPWSAMGVTEKVSVGTTFTATDTVGVDDGSVKITPWQYAAEFDSAPGTTTYAAKYGASNDELHIVVIDENGRWTGTKGTILEKYAFVSKASDAQKSDGTNNYYKNVINNNSKYIRWIDHPATGTVTPTEPEYVVGNAWGASAKDNSNYVYGTLVNPLSNALQDGASSYDPTSGQLIEGYSIFRDAETYDVSLIMTGQVKPEVSKYVVENVAEYRKDCVAFVSPVSVKAGQEGSMITGLDAVEDTIAFRNSTQFNVNSSYAVLDSGFKYQYDRYNDVYRWIPLNGDIAGLCARTDYTNDPWWSPGGLNRGQIKGVVKLSLTPNQAERDNLYKAGINPVVSFPGQGVILYGDRTLLSKPSAFDRINVRRLFIVLEKAIATAAKYQLFEFNDSFTRGQFRSMVEPFLRDVQGRRGIIDFRVKCDDTNNTGEVIDRNEFIADIYIKPARSINFITLNFVAVRTSVSFDEIGG